MGFRRATKKEQRVKLLEATLLSTTMQSLMIMMMMLTENKRETIFFYIEYLGVRLLSRDDNGVMKA